MRRHPEAAGECDHRAVIGAKFRPRKIQFRPAIGCDSCQALAQFPIGANAAGHHQASMTSGAQRSARFLPERVHHGFLETARDIGPCLVVQLAASQGY
jgi:hypothetical protein